LHQKLSKAPETILYSKALPKVEIFITEICPLRVEAKRAYISVSFSKVWSLNTHFRKDVLVSQFFHSLKQAF